MQLTTPARVKSWSPMSSSSTQHDALLRNIIMAVSGRIERHLNRHVLVQLRTEDYYVEPGTRRFILKGAPVYTTSATYQRGGDGPTITVAAAPTLTYDPAREFTGIDAEDATWYHVRNADGIAEFDLTVNWSDYRVPGGMRVTYYSGLAYTLDQLACSSTSSSASKLAVGDAVTGSLSGAIGTVKAYVVNTSITVEVLSGEFVVGENFQKTSDSTITAAFTAWGATGAPLCMAYPEIVEAANMQVSSWFQRREHVGVNNVSVEGATISMEKSGVLLVGVKETLLPFVRFGTSY